MREAWYLLSRDRRGPEALRAECLTVHTLGAIVEALYKEFIKDVFGEESPGGFQSDPRGGLIISGCPISKNALTLGFDQDMKNIL